ncbi:hypothetical protein OG559_29520 [Micromonospora sp. NBC_01405]|uniref:hypothetical protein n=1 Tax=Micromonospora sp. NBC_01405 TaxID=2903589 RepID=UPI003254620C
MTPLTPIGVALLALAAAAPTPAPASTGTPSAVPGITVPAGTLRAGQQVLVALRGWPAGTVQIEVCGNAGRRGALDCAASHASDGHVPPSGAATLPVVLAAPPVACPCVLTARTPTGSARATVALPLTGVTARPAPAPAGTPELVVVSLRAADGSGIAGWFGLPGDLTVDLTLRNTGPVDVVDPPFSLLFGRPERVHGVVDAPALGTIAAGQTRQYRIRVPMDIATVGRHELQGRIEPPDRPLAFTVEAARCPWGLLALAAAPIVLALARTLRRPAPGHYGPLCTSRAQSSGESGCSSRSSSVT